ncbi:MAG: phosphatase PAP2 family protein, partial [Erythrobacter sp.]|nr:phosphatase PAP2 family protein [Erythrobacter sp.]
TIKPRPHKFQGGANLAFPSSHAAVAFGGCLMMAYFMPRARIFLILLAIGCGISRMLVGAHFATDVYVAGLIGWWCSRMICACAAPHVPGLTPRYRLPV